MSDNKHVALYSWSGTQHISKFEPRLRMLGLGLIAGHHTKSREECRKIAQGRALCGAYGDTVPFDHMAKRTEIPTCKTCTKIAEKKGLSLGE